MIKLIRRYIPLKSYMYAVCSLLIVAITIGIHTAFAFSKNEESQKLKLHVDIVKSNIVKDIEKSIIQNNSIMYNYYSKW